MNRVFASLLLVALVLPECHSRRHHDHDHDHREEEETSPTYHSTTFTPPPTSEYWSTSTSGLMGIETRTSEEYSKSGSLFNTATSTEDWYYGSTSEPAEADTTNTWWTSTATWWTSSGWESTAEWASTWWSTPTGTWFTSTWQESTTTPTPTEKKTTLFKETPSPTPLPRELICPTHTYACKNRHKCIGRGNVCDGRNDCPGGDDEEGCVNDTEENPNKGMTRPKCGAEEFSCVHHKQAACLSNTRRCNGIKDCDNGEDESKCTELNCFAGYWRCDDGLRCVAQTEWCNGVRNCRDNSDESHCVRESCPVGEWRCRNGDCILEQYKCDDFPDCWDGSDESNKECIRT